MLLIGGVWASAQSANGTLSIVDRFKARNSTLPQEKIYLHFDKSFYAAGDNIWFRAYLVDATLHNPSRLSKIMYVDLVNDQDTLVRRLKLIGKEGLFFGDFHLSDTLKPGQYRVRAYTSYMRNAGEEFFFTRNIHIANSHSYRFVSNVEYRLDKNNMVTARLNLKTIAGQAASGRMITTQINLQKEMTTVANSDTSGSVQFTFPVSKLGAQNVMSYSFQDNGRLIQESLKMPLLSKDFEVQFFPEGGALLQGVDNQVAFKAIGLDGLSMEISGFIYNSKGEFVTQLGPSYLGMGSFLFQPKQGETYYADVSSQGVMKRVQLSVPLASGLALIAGQNSQDVMFKILSVGEQIQKEPFTLLVHSRGRIIYSKAIALADMNKLFSLPKTSLPAGILSMVLFRGTIPISERQMFVQNSSQNLRISLLPDRQKYEKRTLVKMRIATTTAQGNPIPASLSIAVTDDAQAPVDVLGSNIFSSLLLTSDLKGHVENPGYYFPLRPDTTGVINHRLDVLMLTQGWTRFKAQDVAEGRNPSMDYPLELSSGISGVLKNLVGLARNASLVLFIPKGKPGSQVFLANTDTQGRFLFTGFEYPDSTVYVLQARGQGGSTNVFATFDSDKVPLTVPPYFDRTRSRIYSTDYLKKSLEMFRYDPDSRSILLDEVEVSTQRPKYPSDPVLDMIAKSATPNNIFSEERIKDSGATNLFDLLTVSGVPQADEAAGTVRLRLSAKGNPTFVVDGVERDLDFVKSFLYLEDIETMVLIKDGNEAMMWGDNASANGAIYFKLKRGVKNRVEASGVFVYMPLGYYKAREYYVPSYDVPEKLRSIVPDLRSTIYWNPGVTTDSTGTASVEFYTSDPATTYSVVAEGLSSNGMIGRSLGVISTK